MALSPERKSQLLREVESLNKRIHENVTKSLSEADRARKLEIQMETERLREQRARLDAELAQSS
jgi:hypothetical protein